MSKRSKRRNRNKSRNEAAQLGRAYEMARHSPNRSAIVVSTTSEDRELTQWDRQVGISNVRNLRRNFPLVDFVIEKHCQYNAVFSFQPLTKDREFNKRLSRKIADWKRRHNCDATGRYSFDEMMQLAVSHAVSDGDVGIVYHDGGKLQLIEGDRIRNPDDEPDNSEVWTHGVKKGKYKISYYCIHKRRFYGGFEQERIVPADNMWLPGFRKRIDQLRGISPFSSSINTFQHIHECCTYALVKMKMEQITALIHKMGREDFEKYKKEIKESLGEKYGEGLANLFVSNEDTIEMLTTQNPSNQFQDFIETSIRMAFACLGLPLSFWKGSDTNYYGSEGECEQYIDWCQKRQVQWLEMLREITERVIAEWVADGELELPDGWTVDDIEFEWIGASVPFFRLIKHIKEFVAAFQSGVMNVQDTCKIYGFDYTDNIEQWQDAKTLNAKVGFKPLWDQPPENLKVNFGG